LYSKVYQADPYQIITTGVMGEDNDREKQEM